MIFYGSGVVSKTTVEKLAAPFFAVSKDSESIIVQIAVV